MDRDTLQDDLDLILEPSRDDEPPGEWDWEPPLGTRAAARELGRGAEGDEETGAEARDGASDAADGPEDEAGDDEDEEEEEDD